MGSGLGRNVVLPFGCTEADRLPAKTSSMSIRPNMTTRRWVSNCESNYDIVWGEHCVSLSDGDACLFVGSWISPWTLFVKISSFVSKSGISRNVPVKQLSSHCDFASQSNCELESVIPVSYKIHLNTMLVVVESRKPANPRRILYVINTEDFRAPCIAAIR